VKAFAYIDLVLQDTPLNSSNVERSLRSFVDHVDNLSDREEQKLERMQIRFSRAREFLDYLEDEERREHTGFALHVRDGIWQESLVPAIRGQIEQEIQWIERRLRENREKIAEDILFEFAAEEELALDEDESDSEAEPPARQVDIGVAGRPTRAFPCSLGASGPTEHLAPQCPPEFKRP
jgi:hypothetical protein